jgi:hypothetical protein
MQLLLGSLAGILNILGYVPYIKDILKKKVQPHRITWGIWTILTTIAAFNQVSNGGGYSTLFFISTAILVGIVFILSLRFGVGGGSKVDIICLVLAILLLIYWVTVQETRISTLLAVIIDGVGVIPTLIKTFKNPETETYIQWTLAGIAGVATLLAVPRLDWALIIYPLYVILANGSIVATKYLRERKVK